MYAKLKFIQYFKIILVSMKYKQKLVSIIFNNLFDTSDRLKQKKLLTQVKITINSMLLKQF